LFGQENLAGRYPGVYMRSGYHPDVLVECLRIAAR
jgi:hypothetical protein